MQSSAGFSKISFAPKSAMPKAVTAKGAKVAKAPVSKPTGTLRNIPVKQYQTRQGKKVQIGV